MNMRPATAGDQPVLFEVHRSVFRSHIEKLWGWDEVWQRENFASEFASATTSVIEEDGRIAGYIQVMEKHDRIYVQNVAISEAFQGKGIGTQLLEGLQSNAAARKVPLQLSVFRTNTPAQRLYERLGFRPVGETQTHVEMSWAAARRPDEGDPALT